MDGSVQEETDQSICSTSRANSDGKSISVKRKIHLCFEERLDIIKELENGVSIQELATTYNVHQSTIHRIKQKTVEILQYAAQNKDTRKKKIPKSHNEVLDAGVYVWFLERKAVGDPVTNLSLREYASQLNRELGGSKTFKASRGWLSRFRARYGIDTQLTFDNERGDADEAAVRFVHDVKQIIEERNIDFANLYKLDETGLAWKFLPKKMLTHAGRKKADGNKLKIDRITIGLCTNATGNHKLPPLFIYKYTSPRAFKHCKDQLPVVFKTQQNAWLDRNLFIDWYENDFKTSVKKYQSETGMRGTVLLIVDNCRVDDIPSELLEDEMFHIIFLPPNMSSIIQPIDHGMIGKIKRTFRHKMLHWMLKFSGTVNEFYTDYDVKDCINLLCDAWTDVTPSVIQNAWHRLLGQTLQMNLASSTNDSEKCSNRNLRIMGENISLKEIDNWLYTSEEVEQNIEENINQEKVPQCIPENNSYLEKEEIEKMFQHLSLWCQNQPEFVQLQIQTLKNYYDQK